MTPENARRRQTAHDAWLGQLTSEQRDRVLARLDQELEGSPARRTRPGLPGLVGMLKGGRSDLAAQAKGIVRGSLERARQRAEAAGEKLPAWLVDHPDEGDGMAWVPDEPRESLQRAIDWRG